MAARCLTNDKRPEDWKISAASLPIAVRTASDISEALPDTAAARKCCTEFTRQVVAGGGRGGEGAGEENV